MIDTSVVRVYQHAAAKKRVGDRCIGRSRGGLTTKIHALVDAQGRPIRLVITPGQTHDTQTVAELLSHLPEKTMLLADRGCYADAIRRMVTA